MFSSAAYPSTDSPASRDHSAHGQDGVPCTAALADVLSELGDVLLPAELAQWLAEPNSSLCGCTPADMLEFDPRAVLNAARLDRYIVKG